MNIRGFLAAGLMTIVAATACGGKAIVDPPAGSGGAGSTTSSSAPNSTTTTAASSTTAGVGVTSTTSGGADCDALAVNLRAALAEASVCNACEDGPNPCSYRTATGSELADACGCPVAVNVNNLDAQTAAIEALQAFRDARCELDCFRPCAVDANPTCGATAGSCEGSCSL